MNLNKITALSKRRGFIFPSSAIYGGFSSGYDYGPLGAEMKRNIRNEWWREMTRRHERVVGLDSAILTPSALWEASGHLAGFSDELVECKKCRRRFKKEENVCPECGGELSSPRCFNLMMKTQVGPVENEGSVGYLRAETCQGIYLNFLNVLNVSRLSLPFGIAQIGKAFRNEINPKDFIFRTREFEQMEMQWFCNSDSADKFFDYWKEERLNWYAKLGIKDIRAVEVPEKDRAHYARRQIDIEYKFPFGWKEIEGVHNRGDWDLKNHSQASGTELKEKESYPYVIETSLGVERLFLLLLCHSYQEEKEEVLLSLPFVLAPIKAAVFPLLKNKPELVEKAKQIYLSLKQYYSIQYDESGSVGRRYRRQDEIGTPFCLTVDFDSLENNDVTVRHRDTRQQERIKISDLREYLYKNIYE
jgi:glycyl-tRNA synthetase